MKTLRQFGTLAITTSLLVSAQLHADDQIDAVIFGSDLNSADNAFIQPVDPAQSGGGRDQTMQFGDLIPGGPLDEVIVGRLGTDILSGGAGDDVLMGGTEHFNPNNRDRALGGPGFDMFMWSPGDGSDTFIGGPGYDIVAFGLIGENEGDEIVFRVADDQLAGDVYINPASSLPLMDITNSPGFCEIIDDSTSEDSQYELDALGLDHLVRFSLRSVRDEFEAGIQDEDNGTRVTLHLNSVELLVCASRDGGIIEYVDLSVSPPQLVDLFDLAPEVRARLLSTTL